MAQPTQHNKHRKSSSVNNVPLELIYKVDGVFRRMTRGNLLGKGSFACCFEFIDKLRQKSYAAKVVTQEIVQDKKQHEKLIHEARLHIDLDHLNIVKLHDYFVTGSNFYFMLELCSRHSMMELHISRKKISESESRFFLTQIIAGVNYLHDKKIIHRDLKLSNLLLADNEKTVKIADFGLALHESELKYCQLEKCGTPNYLSPEMLLQKGYSYPVDVWAIGIVFFTLISGIPPFETNDVNDTYRRIRFILYTFTPDFSHSAQELITHLLASDPKDRPIVSEICNHEFFTGQESPKNLPLLTGTPSKENIRCVKDLKLAVLDLNANGDHDVNASDSLKEIIHELESFGKLPIAHPSKQKILRQDKEYPDGEPTYWIARWVELANDHGICYEFGNGTLGLLLSDKSKLTINPTGDVLRYVDLDGLDRREKYHEDLEYPPQIQRKIGIFRSMYTFMRDSLNVSGKSMIKEETTKKSECWPSILKWNIEFDPDIVIAFLISDGSLQVNFKKPHVKIIVSPTMSSITFISDEECFTYKLSYLCSEGCPEHIILLLNRVREIAIKLLNKADHS